MASLALLALLGAAHGRLMRQELKLDIFLPAAATALPPVRPEGGPEGATGFRANASSAGGRRSSWRDAVMVAEEEEVEEEVDGEEGGGTEGTGRRTGGRRLLSSRQLWDGSPTHPDSDLYAGAATHTMTAATPLAAVLETSRGGSHYLRLMADNTVSSEGRGAEGQLGHGDRLDVPSPGRRILGIYDVKQVAAGGRHSLLLLNDGTVVSFGNGRAGQLGHGAENYNLHDTPHMTEVGGLPPSSPCRQSLPPPAPRASIAATVRLAASTSCHTIAPRLPLLTVA